MPVGIMSRLVQVQTLHDFVKKKKKSITQWTHFKSTLVPDGRIT